MIQKLEQLRKLPDQKKQYIAFGGAACITGFIFIFWIVSLSVTLNAPASPAVADSSATKSSVSPVAAIGANLAAAFVPVGDAFRSVASYFSASSSATTTVVVNPPSVSSAADFSPKVPVWVSASSTVSVSINRFLTPGDSGTDVTILQNILTTQGFYTGPINGKFGPATEAALAKFQKAHGIALTKAGGAGLVGTKTKTLINQLLQQ